MPKMSVAMGPRTQQCQLQIGSDAPAGREPATSCVAGHRPLNAVLTCETLLGREPDSHSYQVAKRSSPTEAKASSATVKRSRAYAVERCPSRRQMCGLAGRDQLLSR
jgi:hypothetical protein